MTEKEILKNLIDQFEKLPPVKIQNPTFLEITEYPHYENVCSNVLRFYMDTTQPHGLGNLIVKSLLSLIGEQTLSERLTETKEVKREVGTFDTKRIDLLVNLDDAVIIIENKIYHHLTNQLQAYINYACNSYKNKTILYVLLSPEKINADALPDTLKWDKKCINDNPQRGFRSISYSELFQCIKAHLGEFAMKADTKYLTYFIDFIASMENLNIVKTMDNNVINFVIDNEENILTINKVYEEVKKEIYQKILSIKGAINIPENTTQWIWEKMDLVHDISLKDDYNTMVSVDCFFELKNVYIEIWVRKSKNVKRWDLLHSLEYFKHNQPIRVQPKGNDRGYIVWESLKSPFDTDNDTIITKLNQILPLIK